MPSKPTPQALQIRRLNADRQRKARTYALRLSYWIDKAQVLDWSQRRIAAFLTEAGAASPRDFDPRQLKPVAPGKWSQTQVARLLPVIADAKKRLAFWAKRHPGYGVRKSSQIWRREPTTLFANPKVAVALESEFDLQKPLSAEERRQEEIVAAVRSQSSTPRPVIAEVAAPTPAPVLNQWGDTFDPDTCTKLPYKFNWDRPDHLAAYRRLKAIAEKQAKQDRADLNKYRKENGLDPIKGKLKVYTYHLFEPNPAGPLAPLDLNDPDTQEFFEMNFPERREDR